MEGISCNPGEALILWQATVADEAVCPEVGDDHFQRIANLSQETRGNRDSPRLAPHHAEVAIINLDRSDVCDAAQRKEVFGPRIQPITVKGSPVGYFTGI